jgi:hypothetical protein
MCLGILDARLGIFQTGISAACIAEILPILISFILKSNKANATQTCEKQKHYFIS